MDRAAIDRDFRTFVAILVAFGVPILVTMLVMQDEGVFSVDYRANPTPYGYTVSLLLFLVPIGFLARWYVKHLDDVICRRAFWHTVLAFGTVGTLLDLLLANTFFLFPNPEATLAQVPSGRFPLHIPGYQFGEGWRLNIPVEELGFYFLGSIYMLLSYIWVNDAWLGRYRAGEHPHPHKVLQPNWRAAGWGVVVIAAAIVYKNVVAAPEGAGFQLPGYFIVLTIGFVVPTIAVFRVIKYYINWRALSLCTFVLVLVSLFWEVTLALPYGWWNFQHDQMLGIYLYAVGLPIEEVLLWLVAGWGVVNLYEFIELHHRHGGATYWQTLTQPSPKAATEAPPAPA